jgi:hypothetical protein
MSVASTEHRETLSPKVEPVPKMIGSGFKKSLRRVAENFWHIAIDSLHRGTTPRTLCRRHFPGLARARPF